MISEDDTEIKVDQEWRYQDLIVAVHTDKASWVLDRLDLVTMERDRQAEHKTVDSMQRLARPPSQGDESAHQG